MATVLAILAIAALFLAALVGIILAYHWFRFAMNPPIAFFASTLYAAVCAFLIAILFSIVTSYAL